MALRQDIVSYGDLPVDFFKHLADECTNIDQFLTLSRLNMTAYNGTRLSDQFRLFKSNYSYIALGPQLGYHILNPSKLTAVNVRKGNFLVTMAINLYVEGSFKDAEALFVKAISYHGSSVAMIILSSLSQYPGRIELNFGHIINRYALQEKKVLVDKIKKHFSEGQHRDCSVLLSDACDQLSYYYQGSFLKAIAKLWSLDKGVSLANVGSLKEAYKKEKSEQLDMDRAGTEWYRVDTVNCKFQVEFDASGFLGLRLPKEESWYVNTEANESLIKIGAITPK